MLWRYGRAEDGNIALTGEVDLEACGGEFVLALGFGQRPEAAAMQALPRLKEPFETIQGALRLRLAGMAARPAAARSAGGGREPQHLSRQHRRSAHARIQAAFRAAIIASLSIPWGFAKGDDDLGGYHLAWPRDLVEIGRRPARRRCGRATAARVLHYLQATQEADGHWAQNMWLDGEPYWNGVQMDETALPILLVDLAGGEEALSTRTSCRAPLADGAPGRRIPGAQRPGHQQDRWEEDAGYSPFTLAAEIAALLAAADLAEHAGQAERGDLPARDRRRLERHRSSAGST